MTVMACANINKIRAKTPTKRAQPQYYYRRLVFTDFSSYTRVLLNSEFA